MVSKGDVLWAVAILTFGVGDLVTTAIGFRVGLVETAPVYHGLESVENGLLYAFAAKVTFLVLALAAYRHVPSPTRVGIPIGLSVLGVAIVAWNSALILSVA